MKIKNITFDIQRKLFLIAIPTSGVFYVFGKELFVFIFGDEWSLAGAYASILSPYLLLRFTSTPLDQVFNVLGKQSTYLFINISRALGFIFIFWLCQKIEADSLEFVYILSGFMTLHYLLVTFLVILLVHLSVRKFIKGKGLL